MAHGFASVKEMGLAPVALSFARAGFAVLAFDYHRCGASPGVPRDLVVPLDQCRDFDNAITWLAQRDAIDAERIGIWGTSFGGGVVLRVAADDPRVRCVVSQVPAVSPKRAVLPPVRWGALSALAIVAGVERILGRTHYLTLAGEKGHGSLFGEDGLEWHRRMQQSTSFENRVALRSLFHVLRWDPASHIARIAPRPLMMIVAEQDSTAPVRHARAAYARAREPKSWFAIPGDHYRVYDDDAVRTAAIAAATDWFTRYLVDAVPTGTRQRQPPLPG